MADPVRALKKYEFWLSKNIDRIFLRTFEIDDRQRNLEPPV